MNEESLLMEFKDEGGILKNTTKINSRYRRIFF